MGQPRRRGAMLFRNLLRARSGKVEPGFPFDRATVRASDIQEETSVRGMSHVKGYARGTEQRLRFERERVVKKAAISTNLAEHEPTQS